VNLTFKLVETDEDIALTAKVADEIWHEYWPSRIGQAQTDYMVSTMQSASAIAADIREKGYRYRLLYGESGKLVGYTSALVEDFSENPDDPESIKHGRGMNDVALRRLFISKIYLYASERGKHYASRVIEMYERECADEGLGAMYLTVNRGNDLAIRAYKGRGFFIVEDVDAPIGEGFVMNDHIMAKRVDRTDA
jgi:GNAT superfamily N-acetyltransferase